MQNLASQAHALLLLQPVTHLEADQLDHQITAKVHDLLGFPFRPLSDILSLPVASMGFEFPSIARINAGIAIDGLAQDLNHHVPAYRLMAHITMADWTCTINGCTYPLDSEGLKRDFTHYYGCILTAWIVAQKEMGKMPSLLSLWRTDLSFISRGEMSLIHTAKICAKYGKKLLHGHTWISLWVCGIQWLHQVGEWCGSFFEI